MAYTVLNESLQVKGKLTLNNGQGSTAFFADTITQQIATDNSSDPTNSTAMAFNEYDKQGNAKQWGHSITVSVEATDLGSGISTNDYLMYFDDVNNHYYLMKVITAETDRNSGFVTISGINTAIYELGKQIVNAETTFKQANLQTVVNGIYKNAPFSVVIQDDLATVIDYTVSANTSLQAVLQDLQTKYDVDVDSWIELDESGNISDRIIYFGHIGRDNGELIRYGGAKGFENINAQELSDTIYTKLYVTGLTNDTDPTKGHIGSVNNGMEYILDDNANAKQYAIGASQQQPVYLEGSISNTLLSEPQALLTWAKAQMGIFNHPRFNYTVTPLHDQIVGIGDTIAVQDFHIKPEILVTSKVIQKSTSFSSPETNTFVLGEFSSIFTENANKGAGIITLIKKDVTVVQAAADYAKAQADEAHRQAVTAQEQAIHAQTSADGKMTTYTVDSIQDLPGDAVEGDIGWVKLSDGTHMYSYTDGEWVEKINPSMGADINKKVLDAVTQAKEHVEEVKQGLVNDIATAKSQATSQANAAVTQANAHTATAIEQNNASQQEVMDDIAKSQADLAIKDADFNNKAQAMADKALSDAKANTVQVAQETLNSANDSIAQAKSDITDAYKNADGVISKKVDDTATSIGNTISQNKIDSDGKISTAQSTATQAINAVTTKVSQTVYDQKTGDLTTAVSKAQTTADGAVSTVGNYKTSNDGRVKAAESKIEQNSKDITARVSKTDYDNNNSQLNTRFTKVEATADGASTTVGKLQTAVNNLGQVNQLMNTEFTPDMQGWKLTADSDRNAPYKSGFDKNAQANMVSFNTANASSNTYATLQQDVLMGQAGGGYISLSWQAWAPTFANYANLWVRFYDNNNTKLDEQVKQWTPQKSDGSVVGGLWTRQKFEGIAIPSGSVKISVFFQAREGINAYLVRPMLVFHETVGAYVPGNYNNNAALAQVKVTADGISDIVSNPTTGLSTRVQTAEGTLSTVKGTDIPALQNATFWQPYSSLNFNDYTKQGSFFFNTTAAKTNGPTTSNTWTYLIVEQGTSAKDRIKQTAWYDGVTGVKITYVRTLNSGTWSSWYANDNDSVTTISQTNSDVRQEISDRKTGDSNTLQSSKDFTQSSITSAVNGVNSTITQTSDSLIAKINTKTDSDTVLSLLKDNWSIGITDNISKITSGIVGNSSSMSLIGKNIVLDGNTTFTALKKTVSDTDSAVSQVKNTADSISNFVRDSSGNISSNFQTALSRTSIITGSTLATSIKTQTSSQISSALTDNNGKIISLINQDSSGVQIAGKNIVLDGKVRITNEFTVGQANIANGAIGTAQIGDASITSAKIANLDVSKLTGDTITGFNFNVNRSMNIASGGVIKSDVINMDKTSFILNTSTVATDTVTTAANNKMILSNVTYSIDSTKGAIISSGKVNLSRTNGSTSNANFDFRIAPDYFSMSSKNWSDGSNDNYMTMTDYSVSFLAGSPLIDKASSYSYVGQDGIATTGTVLADAISGHGSKPMYINAGGTLRLAANDGSGVKVYISNTNVQTDSPIISGNITLNTGHAIVSNDNGKMFFYGSNGNQIDLGVRSLTQSSLVSLKEHIGDINQEYALNETLKVDVKQYNFIGDDVNNRHVSPMIDDVNGKWYIPKDWVSEDGKSVDVYTITGYLIQSIKALQTQITELKRG